MFLAETTLSSHSSDVSPKIDSAKCLQRLYSHKNPIINIVYIVCIETRLLFCCYCSRDGRSSHCGRRACPLLLFCSLCSSLSIGQVVPRGPTLWPIQYQQQHIWSTQGREDHRSCHILWLAEWKAFCLAVCLRCCLTASVVNSDPPASRTGREAERGEERDGSQAIVSELGEVFIYQPGESEWGKGDVGLYLLKRNE